MKPLIIIFLLTLARIVFPQDYYWDTAPNTRDVNMFIKITVVDKETRMMAKLLRKNPGMRVGISKSNCLLRRGHKIETPPPTMIPAQAPYLLANFE